MIIGCYLLLEWLLISYKYWLNTSLSTSSCFHVLLTVEESETLAGTLKRTCSLMFDWGAESGVWKSPASFIHDALPYDTLFGMSLPIPDGDHQLHHAPGL